MSSDLIGLYEAGLCSVGPPIAAEVEPRDVAASRRRCLRTAGLVMNGHAPCGAAGANRRFLERMGAVKAKDLRFQEPLAAATRDPA